MSRASIREFATGDQPVYLSAATVARHAGETSHWRINDEGDLEIDLVVNNHAVPITAVMGGLGSLGIGFWIIPPLGAEVIVAHPDDFEGDATIVALMGTSNVPGDLSETTLVVRAPTGGKVLVHDGSGAQALATKADIDALAQWVAAHIHVGVTPGTPSQVSGVPSTVVPGVMPIAAGTSVLEAK